MQDRKKVLCLDSRLDMYDLKWKHFIPIYGAIKYVTISPIDVNKFPRLEYEEEVNEARQKENKIFIKGFGAVYFYNVVLFVNFIELIDYFSK